MPRSALLVPTLALVATTALSGAGRIRAPPEAVRERASFVAALCARGVTVAALGRVEQPFLAAPGAALRLGVAAQARPAEVQTFDYATTAAAATDAGQIDPDGQPRLSRVRWIASPHFFRAGQLLVLYLGDDPAILGLLTQLLGPRS